MELWVQSSFIAYFLIEAKVQIFKNSSYITSSDPIRIESGNLKQAANHFLNQVEV